MDNGDVLTVSVDPKKVHRLAAGCSQLVRVKREEEGSNAKDVLVNPVHIAWVDGYIDIDEDKG